MGGGPRGRGIPGTWRGGTALIQRPEQACVLNTRRARVLVIEARVLVTRAFQMYQRSMERYVGALESSEMKEMIAVLC